MYKDRHGGGGGGGEVIVPPFFSNNEGISKELDHMQKVYSQNKHVTKKDKKPCEKVGEGYECKKEAIV